MLKINRYQGGGIQVDARYKLLKKSIVTLEKVAII
jgi:hypothetical protein